MKFKVQKKRKLSKKQWLILAIAVIFVAAVALLVLEKTHVIDLIHRSPSQVDSQPAPPNTVNYSPPTSNETDDPTIDSIKTSGEVTPTPTASSSIYLIITGAGQNPTDRSIYVGTMAQGATSGTCNLQLIQNGLEVYTTQVALIRQNNLYACDGFVIDIANIPAPGDLTADVTLTSGSESVGATQVINGVIK